MNVYGLIILATLLLDYFLQLTADSLNLRMVQDQVPAEFSEQIDAARYQEAQRYLRVNTRFGIITSTISLAVTLAFWFGGGFAYLDRLVRGWQLPPLAAGLAYIGILLLAKTILELPAAIYHTFVIEARFGFNKTSPATFIADRLKGLALALVLGTPLLAGILWFLEAAGPRAWLYCWLLTTAVLLLLQFIAPTWIMPLFHKFTPLEDGPLKEAIMAYARKVGFSLENVFIIDGSRRSTKANAFFTGFGRHRRVALYDTLLQDHDPEELVAILAHEIGHYRCRHVFKNMLLAIVNLGVMFYLLHIFIAKPELFAAFYVDKPSIPVGLVLFGLLYSPVELLLNLGIQALSRRYEFEADRFAARTTGKPEALVRALKKLAASNLANLHPHPFYVMLHYSHPPLLQRFAALRRAVPTAAAPGD